MKVYEAKRGGDAWLPTKLVLQPGKRAMGAKEDDEGFRRRTVSVETQVGWLLATLFC